MKRHNPNSGIRNRKAYNNGVKVIYLKDNDVIPDGFVKGGLSNRTPEQIKSIAEKSRNTQKLSWKNRSEQEKLEWSEKCKKAQSNLDDRTKKLKYEKYIDTMSKKSQEELDAINLRRSKGDKLAWSKFSTEERKVIAKRIVSNGGGWNKETIKTTIKDRYGVDNISQLQSVKDKSKESVIATNLSKYGFKWNCQLPQCKNAIGSKGSDTKPNIAFANLLDNANIEYEREFPILGKLYDFKVGNILIEINPFATHNSTWSPFSEHSGLDKRYHYDKTLLAKQNGYRCIHVFDWDDLFKILNLLKKRETIYARDCTIKEVSLVDTKKYLMLNHLQGYAKDSIRLGLYYNGNLVSIMTFNKSRYNSKYQYELIRLCSDRYIIGGAEKLFKHFIKTYNPQSIISYCDYSKFLGDVYLRLGFTFNKVSISKHWYNPKTKQHILDSLLLKLGYDKLFNTNFGKGTSNKELMLNSGFVEIYDAGQASYIWINKNYRRK